MGSSLISFFFFLPFVPEETDENATSKALLNGTSALRDEGLPSCVRQQQSIRATPKVIQNYVYSRPPPWSDTLPTIFVITPTYTRPVQKAELTRLANTFLHVQNLHWVVVEDSPRRTNLVSNLLEKAGLNFTHLNVETPKSLKLGLSWIPSHTPRGTLQRNLGLHWLRDSFSNTAPPEGVVYFADDDNTYSLELFEEVRAGKLRGTEKKIMNLARSPVWTASIKWETKAVACCLEPSSPCTQWQLGIEQTQAYSYATQKPFSKGLKKQKAHLLWCGLQMSIAIHTALHQLLPPGFVFRGVREYIPQNIHLFSEI